MHAGEIETSTTLATAPGAGATWTGRAPSVPGFSSRYLDFIASAASTGTRYTARISPSGVLGDPTKATAEKGAQMWEMMIRNLVEFVEDLKGLTLDEIHQRRY